MNNSEFLYGQNSSTKNDDSISKEFEEKYGHLPEPMKKAVAKKVLNPSENAIRVRKIKGEIRESHRKYRVNWNNGKN